jgi:hypothetical protein
MAGSISYLDPSRLEDVLDIIVNVSPDETPLGTMLGKTQASQTLHEWLEYYSGRATSASAIYEGQSTTFVDMTESVRQNNVTVITQKPIKVSDTQRAVSHAGIDDSFEQQTAWEMANWKKAQEWALVNGAKASGNSGVARGMAGLINVITTIATQYNSGSSFGREDFLNLQKLSYEQGGSDNVFDMVLVPARLKRRISSFANDDQGNVFYAVEDKRLTKAVSVIEGDFGIVRIFPHLDVPSAAATEHFLGIREDKYKVAYLRRPVVERLAKVGDSTDGRIVGEYTLEYLAERTSVRAVTHYGI